jgi:membrane protein required for colicin V production
MNAFDITVVILLIVGFALGLARGLVRILIGILTLLVAFFLASRYQDAITAVLTARHVSPAPARIGAYVLVFVATMMAGGLVAWAVGKMLKMAMMSWADRLAGGALGLVAALLAAAFLVHPLIASSPEGSHVLATSKLAPYVTVVADLGNAAAPEAVAKRYESGIDALRKIWRGEGPIPMDKVKKVVSQAVATGEKAVDDVKKRVAEVPKKKP